MKIYSDSAVTKSQVDASFEAVNEKQTKQILQLRIAVGVAFAANLLLTVALRFL